MNDPDQTNKRRRGISAELQGAAWRLRDHMTDAEILLWDALREKRLNGPRFRRQHPVGQFILDFYCPAHKLAIEVDGDVHKEQREHDKARTAHLNAYGYRVVRFRNDEVLLNLEDVLNRILVSIGEAPPNPR